MKKISFILIAILFGLFTSTNLFGQTEKINNETIFKFDNKEVISNMFVDKVNQKQIDFTILGLKNKYQVQELEESIAKYRGVINFTIGEKTQNNEYQASITLYEYADYWMYYKFLFLKNGIENVIFDDQKMKSEKLSEL